MSAFPAMVVSPLISFLLAPRVMLPPSRVTTAFASPCCTSAVVVAMTLTLSDATCTSWLFVCLSLLPTSILSAISTIWLFCASSLSLRLSLSTFMAAAFISFAFSEMFPVDLPSVSVASALMLSILRLNFESFVRAFSSSFLSFSSRSTASTVTFFDVMVTSPIAVTSPFSRFSSYFAVAVEMLTFCELTLNVLSFTSAASLSCATNEMLGD